ncbi:hypothetical protein JCM3774_005201 [Rhodotorula dairenensis]
MDASRSYSDTNAAYADALTAALAHFQSLLTDPDSKSWKPVPTSTSTSTSTSAAASPARALSSTDAVISTPVTTGTTTAAAGSGAKGKGSAATATTTAAALTPGPFVHGLAPLDPSQVRVHRKADPTRNADIVRAVAEVACDPSTFNLDAVRAVLSTPEVRPQWDKLVDGSTGLALIDPLTRITKTDYRLGWPASPRDTITISRTFVGPPPTTSSSSSSLPSPSQQPPSQPQTVDGPPTSLIDLSTSLPRAADEPAFLRPAPPFVRAHTHLIAWCFQILPPPAAATPSPPRSGAPATAAASTTATAYAPTSLSSSPPASSTPPIETPSSSASSSSQAQVPPPPPPPASMPRVYRLRITVFWQWSLRLAAPLSATASTSTSSASSYASPHTAHVAPLIASLVAYLRMSTPGAGPVPLVRGYGKGIEMNRDEWDVQAETRTIDYAVVAPASSSLPSSSRGVGPESATVTAATEEPGEGAHGEAEKEAGDEADQTASLAAVPEVAGNLQSLDEMYRRRERRRLERAVEISLPPLGVQFGETTTATTMSGASSDGWDVRITVKALGGGGVSTSATPVATPNLVPRDTALTTSPTTTTIAASGGPSNNNIDATLPSYSVSLSAVPLALALEDNDKQYDDDQSSCSSAPQEAPSRLVLRVTHPPLKSVTQLLRVTITVQRLAGGKRVRVNGEKVEVERIDGWRQIGQRGRDLLEMAAAEYGTISAAASRDSSGWSADGDADADADAASIETQGSSSLPKRQDSGARATGLDGDDQQQRSGGNESTISLSAPLAAAAPTAARPNSPGSGGQSASVQIASLLRRSYIYFLSLLQEPPAKWRHVTDSCGVSVTQLLSPDPTLTIYRAEAVFVGVGVWDAFATVVTPGVRRTWDKNVEQAVLVADEENGGAGELSEVWWERRKGVWPVAARDSVLLRTAYKSPSSVHIFSSSTDNTTLFPSIPPPANGTIRIQTDLFGWSIEALSPTTTQITLLDQSDPKGWSSKSSWTPQALVQAVAGVRDYSLKYGAPPVVTRLGGRVRKTSEEYDPDRSTLRVVYAPIARFGTAPELSAATAGDVDSVVECEIRCDAHTWASGAGGGGAIEVVVDPPPSNVSCLLRHRLSAGGGLWLTIEHARNLVAEEGRVTVTVRKGSSASGSTTDKAPALSGASPTVTINGARMKVDVEVLDDDKVRALEKRKRVKAAPVPLDQYETLGPRTGSAAASARAAAMITSLASSATKAPFAGAAAAVKPTKDAAVAGQEKGLSALGKALPFTAGAGGDAVAGSISDGTTPGDIFANTTSASAATPAMAEQAGSVVPAAPPTKPPLGPPACALEALAWLQTFHAEQGPELTDPAPGWTNVSERSGVVVRKKVLPRISPTIPVYRGDKIVQGLTADEIASIVTSAGCRKSWDDRVDAATPLASYGHGVTTLALVTKPTFPFRGRFFQVATANAAVKVPSASSGASTSTVLFAASASYSPRSENPFDASKVNPQSLPTGQVLLEGWILETLDPYTSSVLAIPSTRCTFVSCIDQKGSVPLALNTTLNANLAKSMSNVEQFGKTRGPLPRLWAPPLRLQIEGPLTDDDSNDDFVWRLEEASSPSQAAPGQGVAADYDAGESTFRSLVRVSAESRGTSEPAVEVVATSNQIANARKSSSGADKSGAGKSKPPPLLAPPVAPGASLLKNELQRSASLNLVSTAPPILHKAPIMSELSRKSSHNSLRATVTAQPTTTNTGIAAGAGPASTASNLVPGAHAPVPTSSSPADHDILVAEIVVDLKQYPHGYAVAARGRLTPVEDEVPLSLDPFEEPPAVGARATAGEVPLRCIAHDAPLPSILTASLDAWKRANHLIRVLVPTGTITHPIKDPLRNEESSGKANMPDWYGAFTAAGGALVEVVITALPAPPLPTLDRGGKAKDRAREGPVEVSTTKVTGQANKTVMFNGEKLVVQTQKESKAVLARFEDDDLPLQGAKISRVPPRRRRKSSVAVEIEPDRPLPDLLPPRLQKPLAVSTRLLAPKPVISVVDDLDVPDPKSPGTVTPAHEEARSPASGGNLALTPAAARRDTVTSTTSTPGGPLLSLLSGYPLSRLTTSMLASTVDVTETSSSGVVVAVRRTYTLSFVLVVAIISFLIGSLLRSLLTPADYIIYRPEPIAGHSDVEHALLSALDANRRWREARRLLELRGLLGWDLMVAAVKRE